MAEWPVLISILTKKRDDYFKEINTYLYADHTQAISPRRVFTRYATDGIGHIC